MRFTLLHDSCIQKINLVLLVSGMSTVCEDIDGCENQFRCALVIPIMTLLSSLNVIIMYHAINSPGHGNNVFGRLSYTDNHYLKEQM